MSLKLANLHTGRWSITTRLTLLFSVAAALIQVLLSVYLYSSLQHTFLKSNRQFLLREMQVLNKILQERPSDVAQLAVEQREGLDLPSGKYYSRVLDAHQRVISETPGMPDILGAGNTIDHAQGPSEQWIHRANHQSYFVLSRTLSGQAATVTFQMALDTTSQTHRLSEYQRTLLLVFLFGVLLSALAALFIARHGLKSLATMATEVGGIGALSLTKHLTVADYPAELAQLVLSFNHMLMRLNQSFEQLQQFSADIAHELRTPVNNLIGESEVALGKVRSDEDYQQLIASNLDEYHRLSQIIEALLFLARADNTEITAKKQPLNAAEQVGAVFSYFEALAEEKNIKLSCTGDAVVFADMQLLRRVLSNLIHNAIKFVAEGGEVSVLIDAIDTATVITIKDNGAGIAAEHMLKIFDRFYRASASRTEHGTGLGLSIVKSIMALHGGTVGIKSMIGAGTSVTLSFVK